MREREREREREGGEKLLNEELHNLHSSSPLIISNIKSRKMRSAQHTAHMGENDKYNSLKIYR
jgi:hypothetical protein